MYIIHAPSVGVNCTWWVIFSATVTEILQGIRKAAQCLTGFQTGKDRAWKGGKLEELLEIGVSHEEDDKTMGFWSFRFSDIPDISDILTYLLTHFVTHILICFLTLFWHFVWTSLTVWHVFCCMAPGIYSDTCADMVSSDMTTRWPHDDSEAFGRKEKYLTYREHPGTQSV